jgi:hypothetical protein
MALAAIGGVIVLWGLWLEYKGGKGNVFTGRVDLVINGSTKKHFDIPKQTTFWGKAGSVETHGTFIPLKIELNPPK